MAACPPQREAHRVPPGNSRHAPPKRQISGAPTDKNEHLMTHSCRSLPRLRRHSGGGGGPTAHALVFAAPIGHSPKSTRNRATGSIVRAPLLPPVLNGPFAWLTATALLCLAALAGFGGAQAGTEDLARLESLAADRYGPQAAGRVRSWRDLLVSAASRDERRQIRMVNEFFNRNVLYQSDEDLWGTHDYWATPLETLGRAGGDCEDYAVAKYTSLRKLGIPDSRLRIFYVHARLGATASNATEVHMVLGYYPDEDAEPLILDNLITDIRPASRRDDLTPIFSFNSQGLWPDGASVSAGDSTARLSNWRGVLERMQADGLDLNRPIQADH
jgi:predicted transglutaminase-like cysteine proteinase